MSKLDNLWEKLRESEAYQQVRVKYDELDSQAKLYVNLGAVAAVVLAVFLSLVIAMARLNGLKSEINDREETIGYLQRSADTIKQLKAKQNSSSARADVSSPLATFVGNVLSGTRLDPSKAEIGAEHQGTQDKESVEVLVDVKLTQVNLRQIQQFLFSLVDQGSARNLNIKELNIDTKGDPSGWMDATLVVSNFKAK
ncbi:MAG: hypothetical protein HY075_00755 [Deltaproteobacteria bacterium]|nr:hypothetical protein [Deltaproteobacteria bacterium]